MQHLIHQRAMNIKAQPSTQTAESELGDLFNDKGTAWVCASILTISPLFLAEVSVDDLRKIAHVLQRELQSERSDKHIFDSVVSSSGLRLRFASSFVKALGVLTKYHAQVHVNFELVSLAGWIRLVDLLGAEPYMIQHLSQHGGNPSCGDILVAACKKYPTDPLELVPYAEFLCYCTAEQKAVSYRSLVATHWQQELGLWCSNRAPCQTLSSTFLFQPKATYAIMEIQRQIGSGCVLQFGSTVSFMSHFVKHKMWFRVTLQGAKDYLMRANHFIQWSPPHKVTQRWSQDGCARILYVGDPGGEFAIVLIRADGFPVLATYYIAD